MRSFDLAIIGSGPGGYVAGLYASRHKLSVCCIENSDLGGTCLNRGCIPTKVMLHCAGLYNEIRESSKFGIMVDGVHIDYPKVVARKEEVTMRLRTGIETLFRARGVNLIKGRARLKDSRTISIDTGEEISAKHIIIASGSRPSSVPEIPCDESGVCSSEGILSIKELPAGIIVVGGGVIGCEFAAIFNALGCKVTIIELLDRLISMQSREASKKLESIFKKRGVDIFTGTRVESLRREGAIRLKLSNGAEIAADKVLVSAGRAANISDLGLEDAGIAIQSGKISVDGQLRTNIRHIFAIGDCVEGPLLAHKASYDGILAVDAILGSSRKKDYSCIPNCIYTDPEIASVGMVEEEAKNVPGVRVAKFPYLGSGKAFLMGRSDGYIKIIGDDKGAILGIEIFGHEACDLIGEATLAKSVGVNIKDLSRVVHGHPTLSEIFQEAAHIFCGTGIHTAA